jgi:DNA-binding phage protein
MNTKNLTTREAAALTRLARAAESYRNTLARLTDEIEREQRGMANLYRPAGLSGQHLIQAATQEQEVRSMLDNAGYARNEDRSEEDWQDLVNDAYSGKETIFLTGN